MVGKGQLGQLKEVRHRKHLMSCCIHSQFSVSLGKESKAEGISAQKLDFSFRKASKDRSKICLFSGASLPPVSQPILCTQHRHASWDSNASVSSKWSRNMGFLKIFKYITIAKKPQNRTRNSILHLFIDFQELRHS